MKLVATGCLVVIFGVLLLPAVLLGGDAPTPERCRSSVEPDQLAVILATIRNVETDGNYGTRVSSSTASGAYAFIDASWRHYAQAAGVDTGAYPSAWMAPPPNQDAAATAYVNEILAEHDQRIEIIPLAWYLPSAIDQPAKMDQVPPMGANLLTPRQYQARWMAHYDEELARSGAAGGSPTASTTGQPTSTNAAPIAGWCVGGSITPLAGDWSLPGPRDVIDANPDALADPHHDYPAWDWIIDSNTPIYAVRGGRVDSIRNWPHNWWTRGCGEDGGPGCDTCGVGVTIVDVDGHRWTYCHGAALTTELGATVTAGQQLMWSGNTGRSGTDHLHLEIRTDGTRRCPQPLLEALYHGGTGIDPTTLPTSGCSF